MTKLEAVLDLLYLASDFTANSWPSHNTLQNQVAKQLMALGYSAEVETPIETPVGNYRFDIRVWKGPETKPTEQFVVEVDASVDERELGQLHHYMKIIEQYLPGTGLCLALPATVYRELLLTPRGSMVKDLMHQNIGLILSSKERIWLFQRWDDLLTILDEPVRNFKNLEKG